MEGNGNDNRVEPYVFAIYSPRLDLYAASDVDWKAYGATTLRFASLPEGKVFLEEYSEAFDADVEVVIVA